MIICTSIHCVVNTNFQKVPRSGFRGGCWHSVHYHFQYMAHIENLILPEFPEKMMEYEFPGNMHINTLFPIYIHTCIILPCSSLRGIALTKTVPTDLLTYNDWLSRWGTSQKHNTPQLDEWDKIPLSLTTKNHHTKNPNKITLYILKVKR